MFTLHERLAADTQVVCDLPLCQVLLMKNRLWPWLILVPRIENLTEIHAMSAEDQGRLMVEMSMVSKMIQQLHNPDKINVGALGNMVPQLHIHVLGRRKDDPAWPGPVWGSGHKEDYTDEELDKEVKRLRNVLQAQMPLIARPQQPLSAAPDNRSFFRHDDFLPPPKAVKHFPWRFLMSVILACVGAGAAFYALNLVQQTLNNVQQSIQ